MTSHEYTEDYYENGVEKGISGYENYKWMPQRSIPEAIDISKECYGGCKILDFGCAKGFLVKALRIIGFEAYGEDISEYAISQSICPEFTSLPTDKKYDVIICKDVLEHIPEEEVPELLKKLYSRCDELIAVIPLGDNNKFRIREYEIDVTHVTKKDEEWWMDQFNKAGFQPYNFDYSMGRVKENWKQYPQGNGFFNMIKTVVLK